MILLFTRQKVWDADKYGYVIVESFQAARETLSELEDDIIKVYKTYGHYEPMNVSELADDDIDSFAWFVLQAPCTDLDLSIEFNRDIVRSLGYNTEK